MRTPKIWLLLGLVILLHTVSWADEVGSANCPKKQTVRLLAGGSRDRGDAQGRRELQVELDRVGRPGAHVGDRGPEGHAAAGGHRIVQGLDHEA